jgi:outer membrane protein
VHANARASFYFETERWDLKPYLRLRWKSDQFNNTFYGLGIDEPGQAMDYMFGTDIRYHVFKNLYLLGQAELLFIDSRTRRAEPVDRSTQLTGFLGFGFFNDKTKLKVASIKSKPYLRLAHGWATPSSLGDIVTFQGEPDPYNNQLTSLFVGVPVADELFEIPMSIYFTPGVVLHHDSEVQDRTMEYVVALKLYYTFDWQPVVWRFGAAEGLSYVKDVPYVERQSMYDKDYRPSELLNYLDFSLDISLGHLFKVKSIEDLWLGYSIHHRSGIFSTSSAFGRISGGSNYNSVYLQYHW